jgi:hypothetical protein
MTPLISTLKSALGALRADVRPIDDCLVCSDPVYPDDPCVRVLGGGFVHAGCATYRMRRNQRIRRSLRADGGRPVAPARTPVAVD